MSRLAAREETRPTLFGRSEFVDRPERGLAALKMGCRDFKTVSPTRWRHDYRYLEHVSTLPNHTAFDRTGRMVNKVQQGRLILASQSPRRKYLLEQAGLIFDVIPSQFDETGVVLDTPENYVQVLSRGKADEVALKHPDSWVIGADTVVVIDDTILGKPGDESTARRMLNRLSGQTHSVYTGYTLCCTGASVNVTDVVCTRVTFKTLDDDEIEWYIHTKEPFDKAGAYAIQGLGTFLVKSITGSYTNVVGLPVCEVIERLFDLNIIRIERD